MLTLDDAKDGSLLLMRKADNGILRGKCCDLLDEYLLK